MDTLKHLTSSLPRRGRELHFAITRPPWRTFDDIVLCASFPGQTLPLYPTHYDTSCYIPILPVDPFQSIFPSSEKPDILLYILYFAQSLFIAHSSLYVFLLVLFPQDKDGKTRKARIIRVDHTSAIVSPTFDFLDSSSSCRLPSEILRSFFWRLGFPTGLNDLAHPTNPRRMKRQYLEGARGMVAGSDPSVRPIIATTTTTTTAESDILWARSMLRSDEEWTELDVQASRWFRIKLVAPLSASSSPLLDSGNTSTSNTGTGTSTGTRTGTGTGTGTRTDAATETYADFFALRLLFSSKHLFGRGTLVWECLKRGDEGERKGKRYVIKDAWPVCDEDDDNGHINNSQGQQRQGSGSSVTLLSSPRKREEFEFYERMMEWSRCVQGGGNVVGLAGLVAMMREDDDEEMMREIQGDDDDIDDIDEDWPWWTASLSGSSSSDSSESSGTPSAESGHLLLAKTEKTQRALSKTHLHASYAPFRRTIRPTFMRDVCAEPLKQRTHVRLVFDVLGRPLSSFKNTKEMVMAIRDAILGTYCTSLISNHARVFMYVYIFWFARSQERIRRRDLAPGRQRRQHPHRR